MTSFDYKYLGKDVRLILTNGNIVTAFVGSITKAEDDVEEVDDDTLSVKESNGKYNIYFPDEIESIEIIEP